MVCRHLVSCHPEGALATEGSTRKRNQRRRTTLAGRSFTSYYSVQDDNLREVPANSQAWIIHEPQHRRRKQLRTSDLRLSFPKHRAQIVTRRRVSEDLRVIPRLRVEAVKK